MSSEVGVAALMGSGVLGVLENEEVELTAALPDSRSSNCKAGRAAPGMAMDEDMAARLVPDVAANGRTARQLRVANGPPIRRLRLGQLG